jgi:protein gp37
MELFGPWIPDSYIKGILWNCERTSQHTHLFLTKRPWELIKYGLWPTNCWVGASVDTNARAREAFEHLKNVDSQLLFISFEPLLEHIQKKPLVELSLLCDWFILGQKTPVSKDIPTSWVYDIATAANQVGIPIFEKNNLKSIYGQLRQEWPKG